MPYPPERFAPGIAPETIRSELEELVIEGQGSIGFEQNRIVDVELVSDEMTAEAVRLGQPPSYAIMARMRGGEMTILGERYVVDPDASRARQINALVEKREKIMDFAERAGMIPPVLEPQTPEGYR